MSIEDQLRQDLHNHANQLEVPSEIDARVRNAYRSYTRQKGMRNMAMVKKVAFATVASVALFGGVISTGFVSPAMASVLKNVPFVGSVFEKSKVTDDGLRLASKTGHATAINQTVSDRGVNVTITEMINDSVRLSVAAVFEFEEGVDPSGAVQGFSYSLPNRENIRVQNSFWKWSHIGGNKYSAIAQIPVESLPQEYKLQFAFDQIGSAKGDWSFDIPVIRTEETLATHMIDVYEKKMIGDATTVDFKRVQLAPSAFSFDFSMTGPEVEKWIIDEVGTTKMHHSPDLVVYDEKGNQLEVNTRYVSNKAADSIDVNYVFTPLKHTPETLTVQLKEYRKESDTDARPTIMEFKVNVPQQAKK